MCRDAWPAIIVLLVAHWLLLLSRAGAEVFPYPNGGDVEVLDLDAWLLQREGLTAGGQLACDHCATVPWSWQVVPPGLLYKNYLAGVHEPRLSIVSAHERELGWIWEATLGGHVGLVRYGTPGAVGVEGFQLDVEGAVFTRLDENQQLVATDFRLGVPLTYSMGRYQTKFGYYHVSSHLGDEFLLLTGFPRINFARDSIVWGHAWMFRPAVRLYFEVGYGVSTEDGAEPWEFQFGVDYSPAIVNCSGSPFFAINGHLREEVDFGGNLVVEAGWQWRGYTGHLLRTGGYYYNGKSSQFEFFDRFEHQIGVGLWYDF